MSASVVTAYVELCEQLTAIASLDEEVERRLYERLDRLGLLDLRAVQRLYEKLDRLWYVEMTNNDRADAQERLAAKARAWHEARRTEDP